MPVKFAVFVAQHECNVDVGVLRMRFNVLRSAERRHVRLARHQRLDGDVVVGRRHHLAGQPASLLDTLGNRFTHALVRCRRLVWLPNKDNFIL